LSSLISGRGIGEAVLDDPDSGTDLAQRIVELQARRDVALRAVAAQLPRIAAAEATYLAAEADVLLVAAAAAEQELATHDERTAVLLAELERHEGHFVPASGGGRSYDLRQAADLAHLRVSIVRSLAAGEDPDADVLAKRSVHDGTIFGAERDDVYPLCVWGPDAVVPCPAYLAQVASLQAARRDEVDTQEQYVVAHAERKVTDLEDELAMVDVRMSVIPVDAPLEADRAIRQEAVNDAARLARELDAARAELEIERERLATMAGAGATGSV
jgi:hypothetical protein